MDPKPRFKLSYYSVFGDNPISNTDYKGDYFWEKSNVRQARTFAKATGGEFHKWKDADGRTQAAVDLNSQEGEARSFLFKPKQDRSDLLRKYGVGFYEAMRASHSGTQYFGWLMRGFDAWSEGRQGEHDRDGQAPGIVKGVAGLNPIVSYMNASRTLFEQKDIYGNDANNWIDITLSIATFVEPFTPKTPAFESAKRINTGLQFSNDAGLLDDVKKKDDEAKNINRGDKNNLEK